MIMDGPFWSIYPIYKNYFTVGSVIHSRLSEGKNNYLDAITEDFLDFKKFFTYDNYYFSIATIQNSKQDDRSLMMSNENNYISVLGGKIDTVIQAEEEIEKIING